MASIPGSTAPRVRNQCSLRTPSRKRLPFASTFTGVTKCSAQPVQQGPPAESAAQCNPLPSLQGRPISGTEQERSHKSTASAVTRRTLLASGALASAALAINPCAASATATLQQGPTVLTGSQAAAKLGFESRVSEFTLANGMHFICLRRPDAPVVACHTYANVGAWEEMDGQTGIAHLLEHMAFKGTPRTGTRDFAREAKLLDALDEVFYELRDAQAPGSGVPQARVDALRTQLAALQAEADETAAPNAYGSVLQQQGSVGLNATTSHDQTRYFVSLPANKLELWMALEADRFRAPVFRGLYSEKAVVEEERRMRVDDSPSGAFTQQYLSDAIANRYRRPVIGYAEDVAAIGRRELQAFFTRYYCPPNLTIAVVGDVDPDKFYAMAERYWGGWQPDPSRCVTLPQGPLDQLALTQQQQQQAEALVQAVALEEALDARPREFKPRSGSLLRQPARAGPAALLGFYRPPLTTKEGVTVEVLSDILAGGRTSRLISELVISRRALSASVVPGYPGEKRAGLALVYGVPLPGESVEKVDKLLQSCLNRLVDGGVTSRELGRVQRATRAQLLATAASNSAMASALASYHMLTGSWRGMLNELELVQDLTPEQVRSVAETVFAPNNCYRGYMLPLR